MNNIKRRSQEDKNFNFLRPSGKAIFELSVQVSVIAEWKKMIEMRSQLWYDLWNIRNGEVDAAIEAKLQMKMLQMSLLLVWCWVSDEEL